MRRLLVVALLASACKIDVPGGTGGGSGGSGGSGGGGAQSTKPPDIDLAVFGTGATKLIADVGNSRLELDPTQRDALTGLAQCADLISYCYAPGTATVTQCFASTRKCLTQEPWNEQPCCPATCASAFEAELDGGLSPVDALEKVLFRDHECFPGVRALLEAP
jgi:hypothetical protein